MENNYDPKGYFENLSEEDRAAFFDRYIKGSAKRRPMGGLLVPVICFVLAAVLLGISGFGRFSRWRKERACTQMVIGTVIEAADGTYLSGHANNVKIPFQDVRYSYSVDGREYTAVERRLTDSNEKLEAGGTAGIYVDPEHPENVRFTSVSEKKGTIPERLAAAGGVILIILSALRLMAHKLSR